MKCNAYNEKRCGSCTYLNLSYEESIKTKELEFFKLIDRNMIKSYLPAYTLTNVENSRNKAKLAVAIENNQITFGIHDSVMKFSALEDCPLHQKEINNLLPILRDLLVKYKIIPYNLKNKTGELKFVIITKSDTTSEIMLRFVLSSKESLDRLKKLAIEFQEKNNHITLVSCNIQPEHKAILEGEEEIIFTEKNYINHLYHQFNLRLGPKSFFQVTSEVARALYSSVGDILKNNKFESVLDLFCGVGAFSFYSSAHVKRVVGVEISKEAIEYANQTKNQHGIKNIDFHSLDVDDYLLNHRSNFDVIITNPPRKGIGKKGVESILNFGPKVIIYSSCNAETLKNDLELLRSKYEISSAQIFDMFPYSKHFEVLVVLKETN